MRYGNAYRDAHRVRHGQHLSNLFRDRSEAESERNVWIHTIFKPGLPELNSSGGGDGLLKRRETAEQSLPRRKAECKFGIVLFCRTNNPIRTRQG